MTIIGKCSWFATASRRKRWLVGVSGGADSVALLHLMVAAGFRQLVVCHLNHGLRGRAAAEDARFVKRLAAELGLECEIGRADVKRLMTQRGESMETAARFARHGFFAECAGKFRCKRVVLAHHADDQAETVLWNLLRGSHGLKGMRKEQEMITEQGDRLEISRPLLGVRRVELVEWLVHQKWRWREDASNAEPVAVRNRLRNEAIPLLDAITGRDAALALGRGAEDFAEAADLARWVLQQTKVRDPQGRLHLGALGELPPVVRRLAIRDFIAEHGMVSPDRQLMESCLGLLDVGNPAAVNLPGGGWLRRRAGRLFFEGKRTK